MGRAGADAVKTLFSIARECEAAAAVARQRDAEAAQALVERLLGNRNLLKSSMPYLLKTAAERIIIEIRYRRIGDLKAGKPLTIPPPCKLTDEATFACFATLGGRCFHEQYSMRDGRVLGDYTAEELVNDADTDRSVADGFLRDEAFKRELAKRMKPGKTVRQTFTAKQVERLWNKVSQP